MSELHPSMFKFFMAHLMLFIIWIMAMLPLSFNPLLAWGIHLIAVIIWTLYCVKQWRRQVIAAKVMRELMDSDTKFVEKLRRLAP